MSVEEQLAKGEIRYIDRRDGALKAEAIYGERPLRWAYGNPLGRLAQWLLVRRWIVSAWYGCRMDTLSSSLKIKPFIEQYGLDEGEFAEPVDDYNSFNEFFHRKLKPGARPVDPAPDSVVFPADGRHLAFADITGKLDKHLDIPVAASNRINMPDVAENILARGDAQLISMARPMLADPFWVRKAEADAAALINTCIACNQACLDHAFAHKTVSCLVNPRAGREVELELLPTRGAKKVAVIGGGPAGLSAALESARRGHTVSLFEARAALGGQFGIARRIPGKEEFAETIRYFTNALAEADVTVRLGHRVTAAELLAAEFDEVVLATGVVPRIPSIPGIDHPSVLSYAELVEEGKPVGDRVAVIGAGGIGVDISEYLTTDSSPTLDLKEWKQEWGVTEPEAAPGALTTPVPAPSPREVYLLQRKKGRIGAGLAKTTGWVHRASLAAKGVHQLTEVNYERIDDDGLHITFGEDHERPRTLAVDTIVVCAGQESVRDLVDELTASGTITHVIGGADVAAELDAKRAIEQGTRLAAKI